MILSCLQVEGGVDISGYRICWSWSGTRVWDHYPLDISEVNMLPIFCLPVRVINKDLKNVSV